VWSARFAGEGASEEANVRLLLAELAGVPEGWRQARYQCVIVWVRSVADQAPLIATAPGRDGSRMRPAGRAASLRPGVHPLGERRSAAEMTPAEKNAVSHRGQALRALVAMLGSASYISVP